MARRPYPMGVGLETDMETGAPLSVLQLDRDARREEARARELDRHQRLLDDLAGQGGELLKEVAARLAKRIDELIAADPEARTLSGFLSGLAQRMSAGERMAQEAMQQILPTED